MNESGVSHNSMGRSMGDQLITHCKRCLRGVFVGQTWEWGRSPLGVSHVDCDIPSTVVVIREVRRAYV